MKITIKELMMWYNSLQKQIEEKEQINLTCLEQMFAEDAEDLYKQKEKALYQKLANDREYNRLISLFDQLESIELNIDIKADDE